MSEWKELYLDSKNFEWAIDMGEEKYADYRDLHLKYRKLESKQPTHEEIMTKWWRDERDFWRTVIGFYRGSYHLSNDSITMMVQKGWFIDLESSDIPPEE